MRPVLPSSSPREPFLPAISIVPCSRQSLPQVLRQGPFPRRHLAQIAAYSNDTRAHIANAASGQRTGAYQGSKCVEKRPERVCRARAFVVAPTARARAIGGSRRRAAPRSAHALHRLLDRLVGFLGELGIHAADLRHLMHVAVVGALGEAALDLDRLLERLGRQQLLEGGGALLEGALGVVGQLGGDGLPALVPLAEQLHSRVHVLLAELLKLIEVHRHGLHRRHGRRSWVWLRGLGDSAREASPGSLSSGLQGYYMQCTMKVKVSCCIATCDTLVGRLPIVSSTTRQGKSRGSLTEPSRPPRRLSGRARPATAKCLNDAPKRCCPYPGTPNRGAFRRWAQREWRVRFETTGRGAGAARRLSWRSWPSPLRWRPAGRARRARARCWWWMPTAGPCCIRARPTSRVIPPPSPR